MARVVLSDVFIQLIHLTIGNVYNHNDRCMGFHV